MPRTFFDHTGDIGVSLEASDLPGLFREAALAFTDTVTDLTGVAAEPLGPLELAAPSLDDLMVDWLGEILYRFEVRNLLVSDTDVEVLETAAGWTLAGALRGEAFDPSRHAIRVLVKGITYHRLDVARVSEGWHTDVVFDI